ncbi:2-dehydropantoate 2-reductase [Shewanella inventionis]|uniref:2-dehydropantoate 2-reductase n=1 Tax=Shewanella inventionis TaxID=1738770 RepID=A0ABQ1IY43_9GAMM|nr:2-dehydropantoate 2-reductase [Shewanella inventionis]MCL1157071.1 2-dehydropantoate 2-reductase [Shewanella inventionis]GGB55003.1 2-dehydropantoate 2-reductase [Shewanella inventionis]
MKIAIFGAGSTGCYLAGQLCLSGFDVSLICRPAMKQTILANNGITISDYQGLLKTVMPQAMITDIEQAPTAYAAFDVIFVTLKCHQISSIANTLIAITHSNSSIIFMQNGLGSFETIKDALSHCHLLQGITPFNVLQQASGRFHKGTEGVFTFQQNNHTQTIQAAMQAQGFGCDFYQDITPVIYGKLLLNLNNALNAIADLPIKQQLSQRACRCQLAGAMKEWLAVCKAADIKLHQFTKVKPQWLPVILSLPDMLFNLLAKQMLDIDPQARSSMWEDIQAKRKTEIEYINGAVVRLGEQYGIKTPVNSAIVTSIHQLEQSI